MASSTHQSVSGPQGPLPVLSDCLAGVDVCVVGSGLQRWNRDFSRMAVPRHGGAFSDAPMASTTHLLVSKPYYEKHWKGLEERAKSAGAVLVTEEWLDACIRAGAKVPEGQYVPALSQAAKDMLTPLVLRPPRVPAPAPAVAAPAPADSADSSAPSGASRGTGKRPRDEGDAPAAKKAKTEKDEEEEGERERARRAALRALGVVAQEAEIRSRHGVEGAAVELNELDGKLYDALMVQRVVGDTVNRFSLHQIVRVGTAEEPKWRLLMKWGTIGERGSHTRLTDEADRASVVKDFERRFKEKTGVLWDQRFKAPIPGKYAFVERVHDDTQDDPLALAPAWSGASDDFEPPKPILDAHMIMLMRLLHTGLPHFVPRPYPPRPSEPTQPLPGSTDPRCTEWKPFGRLSRASVARAFHCLRDIAAMVANTVKHKPVYGIEPDDAIRQLCSLYLSLLPRGSVQDGTFKATREGLWYFAWIHEEAYRIESFGFPGAARVVHMMYEAQQNTENSTGSHYYDALYQHRVKPFTDEFAQVDPRSNEALELCCYLYRTRGSTHEVINRVQGIYRVKRKGEAERYAAHPTVAGKDPASRNTRLLWHGTMAKNVQGILINGFKIFTLPRYLMFGNGIYFADMSSKSSWYCRRSVPKTNMGLLLLCEVELGDKTHETTKADANAASLPNITSVTCRGQEGPSAWKDAGCVHPDLKGVMMPDTSQPISQTAIEQPALLYNEYVVYDVAQVKIRYLVLVDIYKN